ncbi:hypothetical protein BDV28DRAFT_125884 [Aspergillus coremiiformis]|uniref:Uncharacterized protein n=1 Tax=Aspergillus coremiiformis TaxID=138285 RepID=A0A5N6Z449_9EURO|nr:hypothetical protein BDV28DRAFT_125884 [Aspergillus coremiiformis]
MTMDCPITVSNLRAIRHSRTLSGPLQAPHQISWHVLKSSTQSRELWAYSRQRYKNDSHAQRRIEKYHRYCRWRISGRLGVHPPTQAHVYLGHHCRPQWGWPGSKPCFPGSLQNASRPKKGFWETERARMQQSMERIKKEIAADPYTALFGSRLEPPGFPGNVEKRVMSLCRSVFDLDKSATTDKTSQVTPARGIEDHKYDPISGRMVPRKSVGQPASVDTGSSRTPVSNSVPYEERAGYLSSVDRSKERANENETICQHSKPVKEYQIASSDALEQTGKESSGTAPSKIPQHQDSIDSTKPSVESRDTDIKEQLDLNRETDVDVSDRRNQSGPSVFTQGNQKPTNFTILDSAQEQESLLRAERAEDLDLLRASDIRSLYNAKNLKQKPKERRKTRKDLDAAFDSYVDPVSDVNARGVRERFKQHVASTSGDSTSGALETTGQLHTEEESPSISQSAIGKRAKTIPPSEQARDHSQPTTDSSRFSDIYRVLAYDPSTLQVTQAETISSFHTTHESLHPSDILPRLNNPAKFLPYFREMQADGYEIVSGGGDILVFRKISNTGDHVTDCATDKAMSELGAHVRNEPLLSEEAPGVSLAQDPADPISGRGYSEDTNAPHNSKSKVGKILRRMLISGFATAATCYALGVVSEYFRTGGQDGRGIDGFTEFESDRRHRDQE